MIFYNVFVVVFWLVDFIVEGISLFILYEWGCGIGGIVELWDLGMK